MILWKLIILMLIASTNGVINYYQVPDTNLRPQSTLNTVEAAYERIEFYKEHLPILVMVDSTKENQLSTASFFKNLYKRRRIAGINFMLMKFDANGVGSVLESTHNNLTQFYYNLEHVFNETTTPFIGLEYQYSNNTEPFFAILNGIHVISENSTIILFIGRHTNQNHLSEHATRAATKKNIKILVVWNGPIETITIMERALKDLAVMTGGGFYYNRFSDYSQQEHLAFLARSRPPTTLSTILTIKNLMGEHYVKFPIDYTVRRFLITITSPTNVSMYMIPPEGELFDITNEHLRKEYSFDSFVMFDPISDIYEIHFNITSTPLKQRVGVWSLYVDNGYLPKTYNITITAYSNLYAKAVIRANTTADLYNPYIRKNITLRIRGDFNAVRKISFLNKNGKLINNELNIKQNLNWQDTKNGDFEILDYDRSLYFDIDNVPKQPFYIVINGMDNYGESFMRESYVQTKVDNPLLQQNLLVVQLSGNSQVFLETGKRANLYFEVTNTGNEVYLVKYFCSDQESILISMSAYYQHINPQETAVVSVTVIGKPGTYTDIVTFTARGPIEATKAVMVESGNNYENDKTKPDLDYRFTSDCFNVLFTSCTKATWSVVIKAKDTESGMLELTTNPKGYSGDPFTVGTKQEVTATYGDSCCYPDLQIIATDRRNNQNIMEINAYRVPLDASSITAIVLGLIALFLIILIIVYICRKSCKKQNEYELPTYRAPNPPRQERY